jgi:hypothetical protein
MYPINFSVSPRFEIARVFFLALGLTAVGGCATDRLVGADSDRVTIRSVSGEIGAATQVASRECAVYRKGAELESKVLGPDGGAFLIFRCRE